jgi:hypothetical protein
MSKIAGGVWAWGSFSADGLRGEGDGRPLVDVVEGEVAKAEKEAVRECERDALRECVRPCCGECDRVFEAATVTAEVELVSRDGLGGGRGGGDVFVGLARVAVVKRVREGPWLTAVTPGMSSGGARLVNPLACTTWSMPSLFMMPRAREMADRLSWSTTLAANVSTISP